MSVSANKNINVYVWLNNTIKINSSSGLSNKSTSGPLQSINFIKNKTLTLTSKFLLLMKLMCAMNH